MGGLLIFLAVAVPFLILGDYDAGSAGRVRHGAGERRARLRRRLDQDHQAALARRVGPHKLLVQAVIAIGALVRGHRARADLAGHAALARSSTRRSTSASFYPVLIFLVLAGRHQRREPHRRPRRAGRRLRRDRAAGLHGDDVHHAGQAGPGAALRLPRRRLRRASSGSTRSRRRSSWATPARWGWAARSPRSP